MNASLLNEADVDSRATAQLGIEAPSGSSEPLPGLRLDLEWSNHDLPQKWIARDPLRGTFYSFNELEWSAASLMDGQRDASEIANRMQQRFPTVNFDISWVVELAARLKSNNLTIPSSWRDARRIAGIRQGHKGRGWLQQLMSPLAIRIPLFDPTFMLRASRLPARLLFHPWIVTLWLLCAAGLLLLVARELLRTPMTLAIDPTAIQGDRWLMLLASYVFVKSMHELGHALACVRFGVDCGEVGLLLLCLAPCMYCDTTDSWKLSSKWQRAAISAAGMYVELILATVAAAIWLATKEGAWHHLAASLMIVCSLGTIFINSNPLLKYDGYYILSDLWQVPNLTEQSSEAIRELARAMLSASPLRSSRFDANIWLLVAYGLASLAYRLFVLTLILWISWHALVPLGLGLLAVALTTSLVLGLALSNLNGLRRLRQQLAAGEPMKPIRGVVACLVCLGLIALMALTPLPEVIRARAVTDFEHKIPLFANQSAWLLVAGNLEERVQAGEVLAEFDSPDARLEMLRLSGEIEVLEQELEQLRTRSAIEPAASFQIPAREELLHELLARRDLLQHELEGLVHRAPAEGFLLAAATPASKSLTAPDDGRFARTLLDPANLGGYIERGTLLGWFSKKEKTVLIALVSGSEVRRLRLGMPVSIRWDSRGSSEVAQGIVSRISPDSVEATPETLVGDPWLTSTRDQRGVFRPQEPHYEVSLDVIEGPLQLLRGSLATVQFDMGTKTIWQRLVRALQSNLKPIY